MVSIPVLENESMDDVLTMEKGVDFSGDNDRRKESRRVVKDRRAMVRYEVEKDDRRLGAERRKVLAVTKQEKTVEIADDASEEQQVDSMIGKIGRFFKR